MSSHPLHSGSRISRRQMLRLLGIGGAAAAIGPMLPRLVAAEKAGLASAPSLKGSQPGYYRFQIGELEAVALSDGGITSPFSQGSWWVDAKDSDLNAALQSTFEPPDVIRLGLTVVLLHCGNELVLVDSGCGPLFGPVGGHLVASLKTIGITPDQISAIIVSHLHGDHFGGLLDGQNQPVFPNARLILHEKEHAFWSQSNPDVSAVPMPDDAKKAGIANAQRYLSALKGRWHLVKGGDEVFAGVKAVDAFGHTPGHMAVEISSGQERLLHIADAAHHHAISFEHPEWPFKADIQPNIAEKTRRAIFEQAVAQRLRIFGAHLPFPALGHVRKLEGHFEYVIEPWVSA